jgi:hypothetical protein
MAKDAGADFNSVAIPPDFDHETKEKFDLEYQKALFEEGYRIGKAREWRKKPVDVHEDPPAPVVRPAADTPTVAPDAVPAPPPAPEPEAPAAANPAPLEKVSGL